MLSEDAHRPLTELQQLPEASSLCPDRLGRRLALAKGDVLKLVRELIGSGNVLCGFYWCQSCVQEALVVTIQTSRRAG